MKYIEIRFCPLKGLIIMNFNDLFQFVKWEDEEPFPSPTGVNYYEFKTLAKFYGVSSKGFPSPTGVNYYE